VGEDIAPPGEYETNKRSGEREPNPSARASRVTADAFGFLTLTKSCVSLSIFSARQYYEQIRTSHRTNRCGAKELIVALRAGMMASRLNHSGHVIPALTDHSEDKGGVVGSASSAEGGTASIHLTGSRTKEFGLLCG
jgi:hypothetical protein